MRRTVEALLTAAGGGLLAAAPGWLVGLPLVAAAGGAIHGAIAGYGRIYTWRRWDGWLAFLLDHTWALLTSIGSLVCHLVAAVSPRAGRVAALSVRHNRHVIVGGFRLRSGYVVTIGNTISGVHDLDEARYRRLVDIHETAHVWQTRLFGPVFPLVYLVWSVVVGGAAIVVGVLTGRKPLGRFIDGWAYYSNPFEWWAYSREGRWPPRSSGLIWRRPMVGVRRTSATSVR